MGTSADSLQLHAVGVGGSGRQERSRHVHDQARVPKVLLESYELLGAVTLRG